MAQNLTRRGVIRLEWVRGDNRPLSQNAVKLEDGGLLEIRGVAPGDQGQYVCIGTDDATDKVIFRAVAELFVIGNLILIQHFWQAKKVVVLRCIICINPGTLVELMLKLLLLYQFL